MKNDFGSILGGASLSGTSKTWIAMKLSGTNSSAFADSKSTAQNYQYKQLQGGDEDSIPWNNVWCIFWMFFIVWSERFCMQILLAEIVEDIDDGSLRFYPYAYSIDLIVAGFSAYFIGRDRNIDIHLAVSITGACGIFGHLTCFVTDNIWMFLLGRGLAGIHLGSQTCKNIYVERAISPENHIRIFNVLLIDRICGFFFGVGVCVFIYFLDHPKLVFVILALVIIIQLIHFYFNFNDSSIADTRNSPNKNPQGFDYYNLAIRILLETQYAVMTTLMMFVLEPQLDYVYGYRYIYAVVVVVIGMVAYIIGGILGACVPYVEGRLASTQIYIIFIPIIFSLLSESSLKFFLALQWTAPFFCGFVTSARDKKCVESASVFDNPAGMITASFTIELMLEGGLSMAYGTFYDNWTGHKMWRFVLVSFVIPITALYGILLYWNFAKNREHFGCCISK